MNVFKERLEGWKNFLNGFLIGATIALLILVAISISPSFYLLSIIGYY